MLTDDERLNGSPAKFVHPPPGPGGHLLTAHGAARQPGHAVRDQRSRASSGSSVVSRAPIATLASRLAALSSAMASSNSSRGTGRARGLFQHFGGPCHPPGADASRRALQGMGCRRRYRRLGPRDPREQDGGLTHEELEDLALQSAIAQRHAFEMARIDDARFSIAIRCGRQLRYGHDALPAASIFELVSNAARREHNSTSPLCDR